MNFLIKGITYLLIFTLGITQSIALPSAWAKNIDLPSVGTRVGPSPAFTPMNIVGMTVYPDDPFKMDFIVDLGGEHLDGVAFKEQSQELINYFLAALTVPDNEMWVNLSPYEKDRVIAQGLGSTGMGRDMLKEDYLLKQLTASLMYPEGKLGQAFWKKAYDGARIKFGTTDIPTNTFNLKKA